jgi:hypothetical protein
LLQVVIAPHIYPPSISKATSNYAGSGLFNRLSLSFGTLNKAGYCLADGTCHQFAVCIGETGTAFTNALDTPAMTDFASYLTNTGEWLRTVPLYLLMLIKAAMHYIGCIFSTLQ